MRTATSAFLIVAGTLALAPAADAAPSPRSGDLSFTAGTPDTPQPVTDGRYAALFAPLNPQGALSTITIVRDDSTGRLLTPGPGCRLTTPQGGYAGELCGDGVWRAVNLSSGARAPIPLGALAAQVPATVSVVGHDWAFLSAPDARSAYVNWRTGEQRVAPSSQPELDFAFNRREGGQLPALYRGTVVRGISSTAPFPLYPAKPLRALRLRVAGHTRTLRSSCEAPGCSGITYSGGVLSWVEGRSGQELVGAYVTTTNRLLDGGAPGAGGDGGVDVAHTGRRLYISTRSGESAASSVTNFEAALPAR